jgi:hypothetical protein
MSPLEYNTAMDALNEELTGLLSTGTIIENEDDLEMEMDIRHRIAEIRDQKFQLAVAYNT